jgi:hypothetical protein
MQLKPVNKPLWKSEKLYIKDNHLKETNNNNNPKENNNNNLKNNNRIKINNNNPNKNKKNEQKTVIYEWSVI